MSDQTYTNPANTTTSKADSRRRKKAHSRYAGMLLTGVGLVANVTAITGLIRSHVSIIVITAAVMATLCGLYLLLKRWGKPVGWYTLMAVAVIVAGSVMLSLALKTYNASDGTAVDTVDGSDSQHDSGSNSQSDGKPVNKHTDHTIIFEKEFELASNQGLELDDEKGTIRVQQSTAKSPIDLYLDTSPYFYVTIKNFFPYQPGESTGNADKDKYTACRNLIDTSQIGYGSMGPSTVVPGQEFCIITTRGRVALITMQEMIDAGYGSLKHKASFTVKLWN
ncbi:MAG TPA: hypothetical protein VJ836_04650 [Candidatus Saccharimonadales bacterium]|nr:hypothetical protein [Candidatus Saccharimonadales bacterium]